MAKRKFKNLFAQCFTFENLLKAYESARKGKKNKGKVLQFSKDLYANINQLLTELNTNTYKPRPYIKFLIYEPKPREIKAPHFRDVVVQHCIYDVIYPIFDKSFIFHSYGCRKEKGNHRAVDMLQKYMRSENNKYFLQLDIRRYYYTINRDKLKQFLGKKIKDQRFLDLIMLFADDGESKTGVPIGNLLSQLLALIYLNELDHYIKRELKIRCYVRYVDDFVIGLPSKEACVFYKQQIENFINNKLDLTFSKWKITPTRKGLNFVGFRTWKEIRFVRKRSLYNFSKALKAENLDSLNAIIGNTIRSATYKHFALRVYNEKPHLIKNIKAVRNYFQNLKP